MFGTKNVRVVNDVKMNKRIWFTLRTISFVVCLICISLIVFNFVDTGETNLIYPLLHEGNDVIIVNAVFMTLMWVIGAGLFAFLTFLFHRLYMLDTPLSPKVSEKLQAKLKKYEYKVYKKTNNKQDRQANKALKKDLKNQYKQNKL